MIYFLFGAVVGVVTMALQCPGASCSSSAVVRVLQKTMAFRCGVKLLGRRQAASSRAASSSASLGKGSERVFVVGVGMTKFSKVQRVYL